MRRDATFCSCRSTGASFSCYILEYNLIRGYGKVVQILRMPRDKNIRGHSSFQSYVMFDNNAGPPPPGYSGSTAFFQTEVEATSPPVS
jgi:hypothetical protein